MGLGSNAILYRWKLRTHKELVCCVRWNGAVESGRNLQNFWLIIFPNLRCNLLEICRPSVFSVNIQAEASPDTSVKQTTRRHIPDYSNNFVIIVCSWLWYNLKRSCIKLLQSSSKARRIFHLSIAAYNHLFLSVLSRVLEIVWLSVSNTHVKWIQWLQEPDCCICTATDEEMFEVVPTALTALLLCL